MASSMRGLAGVLLLGITLAAVPAEAQRAVVILSTTTSVQDSGLLDVLVPLFEKRAGYTVKTISVGTGQALALAARGEADVTLAHSPSLEKKYVAQGKMLNRRLVMLNDFVIVGPREDPARVKEASNAVDALRRIAASRSRFVSRGDGSGTHELEASLWKRAGVTPGGVWYMETGQGMGATLSVANEKNAYTLVDRATYLAFRKGVRFEILLEKDRSLLNIYSVMEVNPANGSRVNPAGGKAFADFLVSAEAQQLIRSFGAEKFGQPLFVPVAGQKEEEIGG